MAGLVACDARGVRRAGRLPQGDLPAARPQVAQDGVEPAAPAARRRIEDEQHAPPVGFRGGRFDRDGSGSGGSTHRQGPKSKIEKF
jgi:hypothetical protein